MVNHKKRMSDMIDKCIERKEVSFKRFNCIERPVLILIATQLGIPITQFDKYISMLKAFGIISEFKQTFNYSGYIFNEINYKKFKENKKF